MKLKLGGIAAAVAAFFGTLLLSRRSSDGGSVPEQQSSADFGPVEPYASHEPATTYDPTPKPGTKLFRQWAIAKFGERPGSPENIGRWDKTDKPSEHHEGRAWDLMTLSKAHGDSIVEAMLTPEGAEPHALARRARVMFIIWNHRMWRAYPWQGKPAGSWSDYTGPNPHTDHVHFSFTRAGGQGEGSLYDRIRAEMPIA